MVLRRERDVLRVVAETSRLRASIEKLSAPPRPRPKSRGGTPRPRLRCALRHIPSLNFVLTLELFHAFPHSRPRRPPRLPRCLSRLYYGVPRLRRLRSRRHCGPPPQGRPRLRVLAGCLCPMGARCLGRLHVLGPDHARLHLHGRPGDGLLLRAPSTRRPHHRADVSPRLRARPPPHRARRLPHHWHRQRNAVDLHQRPRANRPRLPAPLPVLESRIPRAGPRCCRRPRPHLARLCPPRRQHRTRRRRHRRVVRPTRGAPRRRVAQKCQRLPRLRRLVPQPLPPRVALRLQRRRLPNAQLYPQPRHHDLRPHGR